MVVMFVFYQAGLATVCDDVVLAEQYRSIALFLEAPPQQPAALINQRHIAIETSCRAEDKSRGGRCAAAVVRLVARGMSRQDQCVGTSTNISDHPQSKGTLRMHYRT